MGTLADGQRAQVKGSSGTYTLSRTGAAYACTCPSWRNQGAAIDRRTCKHLRAYLGDAAETARVGAAARASGDAAASLSRGRREQGAAARAHVSGDTAPPLLLAHKWEVGHDPTGWWMSEKLDGIRAYWDGEGFVSRLGNRFQAPDWFVEDLPADTLDGELWVGRKQFQRTTSIVRSGAAGAEWQHVTYVVFDAPHAKGGFEDRVAHVETVLARAKAPHARRLDHARCAGIDHLRDELARVEALGGEGLMLREPGSPYVVGRSTTLLKVKTFHDAEGRVIGHAPGVGKHKGRLGALVVELPGGVRFNVGTGLSDAEREAPPAIGAVITFRYQELSDDGVPRFPSYVGERIDVAQPEAIPARAAGKTASRAAKAARAAKTAKAAGTGGATPAARSPAATPAVPRTPADALAIALVHERDQKFWRIEVRGGAHYTTFGKVGSAGQTRLVELGSPSAARADAEKRAAQKRREGYTPPALTAT